MGKKEPNFVNCRDCFYWRKHRDRGFNLADEKEDAYCVREFADGSKVYDAHAICAKCPPRNGRWTLTPGSMGCGGGVTRKNKPAARKVGKKR